MTSRLPPLVALALGVLVLLVGPTAGTSAPVAGAATSQAIAIRIVVPGQAGATAAAVAAPADSSASLGSFAYPADGSVLTTGAITATASAIAGSGRSASAAGTEVNSLSFFGGEFTVSVVDAKVTARALSDGAGGDFGGTEVGSVGGSLGDWGTYSIGSGAGSRSDAAATHGWSGSVTAVTVRLVADHGGLPAGSEISVGYATAGARADAVATTAPTTQSRPTTARPTTLGKTNETTTAPAPEKEPKVDTRQPPIGKVPRVQPKLTAGRYVFPVYGDASYSDTFGAPRADVAWHHGDDIFAPLGAPVVAVADGTVFSVGWNPIGGWRLWLRDLQGNEFYYAHLSAYSPYALNNTQVRAGTVLGFVGNTGDAEGTPYHLHFEIHPVALLGLGYDGAVDPTPYLDAWRRLQDIRFSTNGAWLPGLVRLTPSRAPEPGAILLQITDISSANGLDPGSLRRAMSISSEPAVALAGALSPPASANGGDLGRG